MICSLGHRLHTFTTVPRSTQTCIPLGSLHRVPDMARVQAGMSPLSSDRMWSHMECWVPVVMWQCHTVNCYTRILYFTLRLLLFYVWKTYCTIENLNLWTTATNVSSKTPWTAIKHYWLTVCILSHLSLLKNSCMVHCQFTRYTLYKISTANGNQSEATA